MRKLIIYRNFAVVFSLVLILGLLLNFEEPYQRLIYDSSSILATGFALLWQKNRFLLISHLLVVLTQNLELLRNDFLGRVKVDFLDTQEL